MTKRGRRQGMACKRKIEHVRARIECVEAGFKRTRTCAELAEHRTELAEARTELAETRTALAETRAEQAETALHHVVTKALNGSAEMKPRSSNGAADRARPLESLTSRQREILQHIAEGHNTKEIAEVLKLSPKTVEYHRAKLMHAVAVHDIPGLVRLAVRAGLVPAES